jgi:hypothetical protein
MVTRQDSSPKLQDNCGAYSASYLVGSRVPSVCNCGGRGVVAKLLRHEINHLLSLPRLKVIGAVFVLPLYVFMAWIGIT